MPQDKTKKIRIFLNLQLFFNIFFLGVQLGIPSSGFYIVYALSNVLLFIRFFSYIKIERKYYSGKVLFIFALYILYSIYVITNFNGDYSIATILRYVYLPSGFLFYLAPLFIIMFAKSYCFSNLLRFIYKQSIIYICLLCLFLSYDVIQRVNLDKIINHFEALQLYLGGGLVFLIFFIDFFKKSQRRNIWLAVIITILVAAITARRSILATYVIGIIFAYMGKTITAGTFSKRFCYMIFYSSIFIIIGYVLFIYGEQLFPKLLGRLGDDTRSGVELEVLYLLERSGKYLTGLGINSYYYSDYVGELRDGCETGYLNMMMKGGIIYLILFYILCIPAIIKGILGKHKNKTTIMFVLYSVFVLIVGNVGSSTFTFSIRYLIFLFIIFFFYNKEPNNSIKL